MENLILLNFLTLAIAVSAFTYTNILTDSGMVLHSINKWLERSITGRFRWIYTILIGCQFCVAGQWALWYYLYFIFIKDTTHAIAHAKYEFELHVWFVMQTIFIVKVVTFIYYAMDDHNRPQPKKEEPVKLPSSFKKLN